MGGSQLTPDDIIDLALSLRDRGYNIGVDQCLAAQALLLNLYASGSEFAVPSRLMTCLAPIFCSTALEQTTFAGYYENWLLSRGKIVDRSVATAQQPLFSPEKKRGQGVSRRRRWITAMIIAGVLVAIGLLVYDVHKRTFTRRLQGLVVDSNGTAVANVSISFLGQKSSTNHDGGFSLNFRLTDLPQTVTATLKNSESSAVIDQKNFRQAVILQLLTPAAPGNARGGPPPQEGEGPRMRSVPFVPVGEAAKTEPAPGFWQGLYRHYYVLILILASAAPVLLLLLWRFWVYLPRLQLIRWKSEEKPILENLRVSGPTTELFTSASFRRTAQELRRHRQLESLQLDPDRTVEESVRQGGFFTPRYLWRKELPDYLLLIDRAGFADLFPRLVQEMVRKLRLDNVDVECYFFYGTPEVCYAEASGVANLPVGPALASMEAAAGRAQTKTVLADAFPFSYGVPLQDLAARYPDHQLLIFSDAENFFSPHNGRPYSWLEKLGQWSTRVLLLHESKFISLADYQRQALEDNGIEVVPANQRGLAGVAELVHGGSPSSTAYKQGYRTGIFPRLLTTGDLRWLSDLAPEPALVSRLLAQLRSYLGQENFLLLAACAVYPDLSWDLTLYLALKLGLTDEIEQRISALFRLPWFRHGNMPNWLRDGLLRELSPSQRLSIRDAIWHLLSTALERPLDGFDLRYAHSEGHTLKQWAWRDLWTSRLLRNFLRTEPANSPLQDYLFLAFLYGRSSGKGFPLPRRLQTLWTRFGQPRRPWLQAVASILAMIGIAGGLVPLRPTSKKGTEDVVNFVQEGDFAVALNTVLSGPREQHLASTVGSPSVAASGAVVFYTGNWYAALSVDGGKTFKYIDPEKMGKPGDPSDATFCCDQVVNYIPAIDTFVWLLQYGPGTGDNILRLEFATSSDLISGKPWRTFDITGKAISLHGCFLDYEDIAVGSNFLYITTNCFGRDPQTVGSAVLRIPFTTIASGKPTIEKFVSQEFFSPRVAQNTGKTAYFAFHRDTSTLAVFSWPEGESLPSSHDVAVARWIGTNGYISTTPDGRRWLDRIDPRITGATLAGNELWLAWSVDKGSSQQPQPFIQIARIDVRNMTLIENLIISDPDSAVAYPALTTNADNEVGITYMIGGGKRFPSHVVGILTGTPRNFVTAVGERSPVGDPTGHFNWGDYLTIRPVFPDRKLFAAAGYTLQGKLEVPNEDATPRLVIFGRSRDARSGALRGREDGQGDTVPASLISGRDAPAPN